MPSRIGGQIALLIVGSLAIANIATATVFLLKAPPTPPSTVGTLAGLAFTAKLLDAAPTKEIRAEILRNARQSFSELAVISSLPATATISTDGRAVSDLKAVLGSGFSPFIVRTEDRQVASVAVRLSDGEIITAALPPLPSPLPMIIGTVTFLAIVLTLLFVWVAHALTRPLGRFADAAEQFSAGHPDIQLSARGPTEMRRLAQALNEMQSRINALISDRTHTLAAIGHDLRTPITRLRLRAEDIESASLRGQVIRDLDTMQHMVQSALAFLRGQSTGKSEHVRVDLVSLVQTLRDDLADSGSKFRLHAPPHIYVTCDPDQIMRAVGNLVDNGLKFGSRVSVSILEQDDNVLIEVADDGPGIRPSERSKVGEPFYRADGARNADNDGGFGLGLSIVRNIIEAHGGRIELHEAQPHGLSVRIILPADAGGRRRPDDLSSPAAA